MPSISWLRERYLVERKLQEIAFKLSPFNPDAADLDHTDFDPIRPALLKLYNARNAAYGDPSDSTNTWYELPRDHPALRYLPRFVRDASDPLLDHFLGTLNTPLDAAENLAIIPRAPTPNQELISPDEPAGDDQQRIKIDTATLELMSPSEIFESPMWNASGQNTRPTRAWFGRVVFLKLQMSQAHTVYQNALRDGLNSHDLNKRIPVLSTEGIRNEWLKLMERREDSTFTEAESAPENAPEYQGKPLWQLRWESEALTPMFSQTFPAAVAQMVDPISSSPKGNPPENNSPIAEDSLFVGEDSSLRDANFGPCSNIDLTQPSFLPLFASNQASTSSLPGQASDLTAWNAAGQKQGHSSALRDAVDLSNHFNFSDTIDAPTFSPQRGINSVQVNQDTFSNIRTSPLNGHSLPHDIPNQSTGGTSSSIARGTLTTFTKPSLRPAKTATNGINAHCQNAGFETVSDIFLHASGLDSPTDTAWSDPLGAQLNHASRPPSWSGTREEDRRQEACRRRILQWYNLRADVHMASITRGFNQHRLLAGTRLLTDFATFYGIRPDIEHALTLAASLE